MGPMWDAALAFGAMPPQNRGFHWWTPVLPLTVVLPDCEHPHVHVCVCVCVCACAHTGTHVSLSS